MSTPKSLVGRRITDTVIQPPKTGTIVWISADRSDLLVSWHAGSVTRLWLSNMAPGRYTVE
jgi:hypothetical protein